IAAPSPANRRAMPRPMPWPEPVTIATRPSSRPIALPPSPDELALRPVADEVDGRERERTVDAPAHARIGRREPRGQEHETGPRRRDIPVHARQQARTEWDDEDRDREEPSLGWQRSQVASGVA